MNKCWDCNSNEKPIGVFCAKCYGRRIIDAKKGEAKDELKRAHKETLNIIKDLDKRKTLILISEIIEKLEQAHKERLAELTA